MSAHRLAPLRRRGTIAQRWARIRKRLRLLSFQIARVPINDRRTYGTLAVRARYLTALARSTAQRRRWGRGGSAGHRGHAKGRGGNGAPGVIRVVEFA